MPINSAICGIATAIDVEPRGASAEASNTPANKNIVRLLGKEFHPEAL
jgi:hypothetical protein